MELMDFSLEAVAKRVYQERKESIPEEIIGKITVAVSIMQLRNCGPIYGV